MSYPSEFQGPDGPVGGYEAVEPAVFMGLEPMLLLLLLLIGLALLALGWWLGHRAGSDAPDAADSIWTAISDACADAMKANSDNLPDRARTLKEVIDERLGAVLLVGKGLSPSLKALNEALAGRTREAAAGHHDASGGGHGAPGHVTVLTNSHLVIKDGRPQPDEGHGEDSHPAGDAHGRGAQHGAAHGHGGGHEHPERDMTAAERPARLRAAVSDINDHWCQKSARIGELRAARRALCREVGPTRPKLSHSSH